jgi:hypothetical protein
LGFIGIRRELKDSFSPSMDGYKMVLWEFAWESAS